MLGMRGLHYINRGQTKTAQLIVVLYGRQIGEQEGYVCAKSSGLRRLSALSTLASMVVILGNMSRAEKNEQGCLTLTSLTVACRESSPL